MEPTGNKPYLRRFLLPPHIQPIRAGLALIRLRMRMLLLLLLPSRLLLRAPAEARRSTRTRRNWNEQYLVATERKSVEHPLNSKSLRLVRASADAI